MKKILAALVAVLVLGTLGYMLIENMKLPDALLSTASVMTTNGVPQNLSSGGKLFTTALIVASVGLIIAAISRLINPPVEQEEEMLSDFFGPGNQNLMMKEIKVGKSLSGMTKEAVLQKHGIVVIGVKHKGGFDINAPLKMRIKSGSSLLVMGTPAALLRIGKK